MQKILTLFLTLISSNAFAVDDLSKRIENFNETILAAGNLTYTIIGLVGVVFLVLGITGIVKYSKNTDRESWVLPMVMTIGGATLSSFTAYKEIMSKTITDDKRDNDVGKFEAKN